MEISPIDGQLGSASNGSDELQLKEDVQDFYNFRMHLETLSKEELMETCLQLYKEKKNFEQYIQTHQLTPRRQRPKIRNTSAPIVEQLPVPPPNNPFATALFMDCTKVTECYLQVRWYFQRHWTAEKHNDILTNAKSERKIEEKELLVLVYVKDEYLHPQHINIPTYQILQDLKDIRLQVERNQKEVKEETEYSIREIIRASRSVLFGITFFDVRNPERKARTYNLHVVKLVPSMPNLGDTQTHVTAGYSESNSNLPSLHELLSNQPVSMIVLDRIEVHLTRPGSEPSAKLKEEWVQIANKQRESCRIFMYETLKEETVLAERDHNENRKKKRKKSEDEMTPPL